MFKLLFLIPVTLFATQLDDKLSKYIEIFNLKSPKTYKNIEPLKYEFGKSLFEDTALSLSDNISCKTCHDPQFGTSDGIPFSIGTGGIGIGSRRVQAKAGITPRSSPHLFNKGHESFVTMFWDGRVLYNSNEDFYETPEEGLNGSSPLFFDIVSKIDNVMAMQALFPIADTLEMRGRKFESLSNRQVWKKVAQKIKRKAIYKKYINDGFNIADIANALAYFQKIEFQVNDTRYDDYINGNISALSDKEKRGMLVFVEKARCVRCHKGELLTNKAFQNVASPQLGPGKTSDKNDEGRYLVTGDERFKYGFLTQPLRNIVLTAPFMHDGAFATIDDVIEHYDNPFKSLDNYSISIIPDLFSFNYNSRIYVEKNQYRNFYRKENIAPVLRRPLNLSKDEKLDLKCFLEKSLTSKKYLGKKIPYQCN
ncbi:MAG: hypothetical protein N4A33_01465 [Bacteriovoracaceae bacterium]|jgi:cytochrome c peroxidase|nr:hypothetical protein [Bacteriovoracaceae bacterium]